MLMPTIWGESLFDDFFEDFRRPAARRAAVSNSIPAVMKTDIKELENAFELHIDLPGYKKENVQAELKDGYLTVTADNRSENEEKDEQGRFIRRERYFGSCSRSFYVGEHLTQDDIKAKFEDGILKLEVPKKEAKPAVEEKHYIAIEG